MQSKYICDLSIPNTFCYPTPAKVKHFYFDKAYCFSGCTPIYNKDKYPDDGSLCDYHSDKFYDYLRFKVKECHICYRRFCNLCKKKGLLVRCDYYPYLDPQHPLHNRHQYFCLFCHKRGMDNKWSMRIIPYYHLRDYYKLYQRIRKIQHIGYTIIAFKDLKLEDETDTLPIESRNLPILVMENILDWRYRSRKLLGERLTIKIITKIFNR